MKRKQRVLLIRTSYVPGHMGMHIAPPLGVLTLAAILRRDRPSEVEFKVVNTGIGKITVEDTAEIISDYQPDVVGLSGLSLETKMMHGIAGVAKRIDSKIKVVIGGPHATSFYDDALKDSNVDYAVVGEGEETFIELLDVLRDGSDGANILGVASKQDGEVQFPGPRPFIEDLDSLPIPAWDLIDLKPYTKTVNMNGFLSRKPYAGLFTSRACPYKCTYCHHIFGKNFRAQSADRVLEEIEVLSNRFGVREIHIYDDVFNFDRDRVVAIAEGVLERGIDMKFCFPNGVRGDIMTREMIKIMAQSGVYAITYAIETATPRIQKLIKKNLNLDRVFEVIEWTFDEGIIPAGFFMFGFPTETREEIEETVRFACRSKLLQALFFSVTPFPRTELSRMVKKTYPDLDLEYDFAPDMHYWPKEPYYTKVTGIDLMDMRFRAMRSFYGNPWRLWNILKRYPPNFWRAVSYSLAYWFLGYGRKEEE